MRELYNHINKIMKQRNLKPDEFIRLVDWGFDRYDETQRTLYENLPIDIDEAFKAVSENKKWLELLDMQITNKDGEARNYLGLFYYKLKEEGVEKKSIKDTQAHFARWLRYEKRTPASY